MKMNKTIECILPCMTVLALAMAQVHASESTGTTVSGEITTKIYSFNYTGGPGAGLTPYLQSYSGQESWSGDRGNGLYADIDLNLTLSGEQGDILNLERQGFGLNNHRGSIKGGGADIGFHGYYSHFRSNTGGVDYVNRPGTVDNPTDPLYTAVSSGMISNFTDDGLGQTNYHTERTRYGVGVKFKPDLLGKGTSLSVNFDGYNRDGNKFATWIAGNGDFVGDTRYLDRWRGYDKPVDENMGKVSLNFTASPAGMFQFSYDGSYEKFNNKTSTSVIGDFDSFLNHSTVSPIFADTPLHFTPDSTLMTHALRVSKNFGATAVAVGYGRSTLEQDSFLDVPLADRFVGKIGTENAFLNVNHRVSPTLGVEGFVKYDSRDNDSSTQADGLDRTVRDEWGLRISNMDSLSYGLSASFRGLPAKSTLTAGWKREDSDREFQWNTIPAADNLGQWPTASLYREKTVSDEIYLKWVARPMQGMTLRITPSYIWADKTASITLPEESMNLKTALSYVMTNGMQVNAYYNFKDKKNGNQSFTDTNKPASGVITLGPEYSQKADDTFHAVGVSLNLAPMELVNASISLDWMQNDFETYFFGTNRRRFETDIVFDPRGTSAFKADTWSLSLNGDFQANDRLLLNAGYTFSKSDGYLRTTGTATSGGVGVVNDNIDNILHSFILGANYSLRRNMTLRGGYTYDKYKDDTYDALSGGVHTFMVGVSFAL
ncbi:MAG: MtrB/PioB family outer membrane beta-barrel protein [Thiohalomonadaceae bacterium]